LLQLSKYTGALYLLKHCNWNLVYLCGPKNNIIDGIRKLAL